MNIVAWFMGLLALIPGLGPPPSPSWNGYVENDYRYAASPSGGTIASVAVVEQQQVQQGDLLFRFDATQQTTLHQAAVERVAAAQANLDNLKTGSRNEEVDVIRASLKQGEADLALAQQNFTRSQELSRDGVIPQAQLDQAQAALGSARAAVEQLGAQLKVAELPARDEQRIAAEATLRAAEADAATAEAVLITRDVLAPATGRVERLYFHTGEVAGAGVPLAALTGVDTLKVKFYVSEAERPQLALGQAVLVTCDGCRPGLTARISHFASQPQFTPPIIYSRAERNRLVFLTEAIMTDQNGIQPGQPVTVEGRYE